MAYTRICILQYCWINCLHLTFDFPTCCCFTRHPSSSLCFYPLSSIQFFPLHCTKCQFTNPYLFYLLSILFSLFPWPLPSTASYHFLPWLMPLNCWQALSRQPSSTCCQSLDLIAILPSVKPFSFLSSRAVVSKCHWTHTLHQKSNFEHHHQYSQFYYL